MNDCIQICTSDRERAQRIHNNVRVIEQQKKKKISCTLLGIVYPIIMNALLCKWREIIREITL